MAPRLELDELIEHFTLLPDEVTLLGDRSGASRLGFALACLRILQAALVYVNTLMLQDVLDDPDRADGLSPADRRGMSPLFWTHVLPYGQVHLDMASRLPLST